MGGCRNFPLEREKLVALAYALLGADRLITDLLRICVFGLLSLEVRHLFDTYPLPPKEELPRIL